MATRRSPMDRAASRTASIDTTGMDPEMKATLGGETKRKAAEKMIYSGGAKAGEAITKAENWGDNFKKMFQRKPKVK